MADRIEKTLTQRQLRVGEMIKQSLGMIFVRNETKIPNLETNNITVTEVKMSQDLKIAKAYVLPLGGKDADTIVVLLQDSREALAKVIGIDRETDLAVLKIDLNELETITIGDPSQAMVGDVVLAIGNPYGFGHTVTQGIISATGRYGLKLTTYENFIQTDAAINPGNSGGALVDAQGQLLGINTAIQSNSGGSQGIGLATPSDLAMRIMSDIIQYGKVIRGWLGIEARAIPMAIAQAYNLPLNNGVIITGTYHGGPAENSGLMGGDIITSINDQPVSDGYAGMNFIAATRPGEEVTIEIIREGQTMKVNAVVGSRPDAQE